MSVRAVTPRSLRRVGRRTHDRARDEFGAMTERLRLRPGFIMIGVQRSGTTSMFRMLEAHPQVVHAHRKQVNYFDLNYARGMSWYYGHFPVASRARHSAGGFGEPVAFEASGYYIYHPFALERMARDLPDMRLVVMLRDPIERAYSAYKHEYARGYEAETFERALELEDSRLAGEVDRMREDIGYESHSHRHHSYKHRGLYAQQLQRAFGHYPRSQVHVLDSELYFSEPAKEYGKLLEFLGLRPFQPAQFAKLNARPGAPMQAETRAMLREYYRPHDESLAELLGRTPSWVRPRGT
jgi:Sulfotransferase domain